MRLLLVIVTAIASTGAGAFPEMEKLESCVSGLRVSQARYAVWLSGAALGADPKLDAMADGIRFQAQNLDSLRRRWERPAPGPVDRILLSNAVIGCESYRYRFETEARRLISLMACVLALAGTLTLHAFLTIFSAAMEKRSHAGIQTSVQSPSAGESSPLSRHG